jgi:hypothetical protein
VLPASYRASPREGGSVRVEQVAAFPWHQWQLYRGIGGSFGVEYANIHIPVG